MSVHEKMNFETKQAIKNAFIQQVEEVGFERVTVKNLALVAEINRGTFYLHYSDKYDVMEDLRRAIKGVRALCQNMFSRWMLFKR